MNNLKGIYHKMRKMQPESARILVRKVLKNTNGNVKRTASILGISRITVRRARDGSLKDESRRPKRIPSRTPFEDLIVEQSETTGYRYRLLSKFIELKHGFKISENTIKAVLKRRKVQKKKIRSYNGNVRHLYDYEHLYPFTELQMDTKHILDKTSLPRDVYEYIQGSNLPVFEWNVIDAATRTRFTAYSYKLSAEYGFSFIMFVLLWLRTHNVKRHIHIQLDNGSEFCKGSKKKEEEWNEIFSMLNANISAIPAGAKQYQALVENSHRKDDQYFFSIHPKRCSTIDSFMRKVQQWQDTWNTARPSYGICMNGLTPYEKFKRKNLFISEHIFNFPVFLMESFIKRNGSAMQWLHRYLGLNFYVKGGKYVYTTCPNKNLG